MQVYHAPFRCGSVRKDSPPPRRGAATARAERLPGGRRHGIIRAMQTLTLDSNDFAAMLGYTEDELDRYFADKKITLQLHMAMFF